MKWGISFKIPATYESDLWVLPPPSNQWRLKCGDGRETINIFYHFLHPPQSKIEWQRVAGIKIQIQNRIKQAVFDEYEPNEVTGIVYTVSELGRHFKDFVKFPAPFFDGKANMILTRHAKRLHYEGLLHLEQLIFVSMWIAEIAPKEEQSRRPKKEGMRQIAKRAMSAYEFALDHREEWPVKLSDKERYEVLSQSAMKSAEVRSAKSQDKREMAKTLRSKGVTFTKIALELGVSLITVKRWAKT